MVTPGKWQAGSNKLNRLNEGCEREHTRQALQQLQWTEIGEPGTCLEQLGEHFVIGKCKSWITAHEQKTVQYLHDIPSFSMS